MLDNTNLSQILFKATFAPDLDTSDDLMFSALRAMVAVFNEKSDGCLTAADFKKFLDYVPANQRAETVRNIIEVTDTLNARLAC